MTRSNPMELPVMLIDGWGHRITQQLIDEIVGNVTIQFRE